MSKVKVIQLIFMLILSGKSFAGPPPKLSQKSLHLQSRLSYFQTDDNYESEGGSFVNLGGDRSYKNLNAQLGAFYTFANDLGLFTELNFANATSVATDFERTNTEFTEITGGFNYQWFNQPVEIIPTAHLTIPFNRIDIATDEVLTGEGAIQVLLGSLVIITVMKGAQLNCLGPLALS